MDGGAWWAAVHGVAEGRALLSDFTFTFHFHALEKEMATHSSTLAWKIPWMEEPGGLQSMGSQSWTQLSDFTFTLFSIFLPRMGIAGSFGGFPPANLFLFTPSSAFIILGFLMLAIWQIYLEVHQYAISILLH